MCDKQWQTILYYMLNKEEVTQVQISCTNLYATLYTLSNIPSHVDRSLLNTNESLNRVNFFFPIHVPKSKQPPTTPPPKKKKKKNTGSHQWISLATNPYFYTPKNKITKPPPTVVHKKILSTCNIPTPTLVQGRLNGWVKYAIV